MWSVAFILVHFAHLVASSSAEGTPNPIQSAGIELLTRYRDFLSDEIYRELEVSMSSDAGFDGLSKLSKEEWIECTGDEKLIGTVFYRFFQGKEKSAVTVPTYFTGPGHSMFECVYKTPLPLPSVGSHSSDPLHLKTNWVVGEAHCMYNLEFRGHLFLGTSGDTGPIHSLAVGYLYGDRGVHQAPVKNYAEGVTVDTYTAEGDNRFCFRLTAMTNWHASELVIFFVGGVNSYHQNGLKTIQFIDAKHAPADDGF